MSSLRRLLLRARPALPVLLALLLAVAWHLGTRMNASSTRLPQGRYHANGQIQMSNGSVLNVSHSIRFQDSHFYAITRQGDILQESTGLIERTGNSLQLLVQKGEVTHLNADTDTELIESLLYSRHQGARITLHQLGHCLYARASLQLYCPTGEALSLR